MRNGGGRDNNVCLVAQGLLPCGVCFVGVKGRVWLLLRFFVENYQSYSLFLSYGRIARSINPTVRPYRHRSMYASKQTVN